MLDADKDKRRPLIEKGSGMREEEEEEEPGWFARSEEELPNPEELMPLSQSLITPDLAYAFNLPNTAPSSTAHSSPTQHQRHLQQQQQADLNSELEGGGKEEAARTMKRPRLVWTPQLHKRFVDAVAQLGIKNAVPKTIMQLMGVEGLTRENVASHLQKYRLYLKRVEGDPAAISSVSTTDRRLFSGAPVQQHLLLARGAPEPFAPFIPPPALQHQQQYYHQRRMGQFGSPSNTAAGFDHRFMMPVVSHPAMHSVVGNVGVGMVHCLQPLSLAPYVEDLESGIGGRGGEERRALTLFPAGDD